jgi:hypothetical protein
MSEKTTLHRVCVKRRESTVIPAQAGIQNRDNAAPSPWIPAFAGMTARSGITFPPQGGLFRHPHRTRGNHPELVAGGHPFSEGIGRNERDLAAKVSKNCLVGGKGPLPKARLTPSVENRMDAIWSSIGRRRKEDGFGVRIGRNSASPVKGQWRRRNLPCVSGAPSSGFREIPTSRNHVPIGISTKEAKPGRLRSREAVTIRTMEHGTLPPAPSGNHGRMCQSQLW